MKITMRDVRAAGMCGPGARRFIKRYKLNVSKFLHGGLDHEEVEATGDAMGIKVVGVARERRG